MRDLSNDDFNYHSNLFDLSEWIDAEHQIVQQNSEVQAQENTTLQERDLYNNINILPMVVFDIVPS